MTRLLSLLTGAALVAQSLASAVLQATWTSTSNTFSTRNSAIVQDIQWNHDVLFDISMITTTGPDYSPTLETVSANQYKLHFTPNSVDAVTYTINADVRGVDYSEENPWASTDTPAVTITYAPYASLAAVISSTSPEAVSSTGTPSAMGFLV